MRAVANGAIVRADGKIVVAGMVGGRVAGEGEVPSRGTLDRSFGSGGTVLTDFGSLWAVRGR
jgi:hypothetical protein